MAFFRLKERFRINRGWVLLVDGEGNALHSLQDPEGRVVPSVTSVHQEGQRLYLSNYLFDFLPVYDPSSS
jgi:hypothetical protein